MIRDQLMRGEIVSAGSKLYAMCSYCGSVVRINKPILGDFHVCLTEEERAQVDAQRARAAHEAWVAQLNESGARWRAAQGIT